MTDTWRPEGWDKTWQKSRQGLDSWTGKREIFEAGADAMLEALRGKGKHFERGAAIKEPNLSPVGGQWMNIPGTVVFIPDDGG